MSQRSRLAVPALLGLAGALAVEAMADFIVNHAATRARTHIENGPPDSDDIQSGRLESASSASAAGDAGYPGSTTTVNSRGRVDQVPAAGGRTWSLNANASLDVSVEGQGSAEATATWEDIVFLSTYDPRVVGNTLRLNFESTGELRYEGTIGIVAGSRVDVAARGSNDGFAFTNAEAFADLQARGQFNFGGWDSFGGTADAFSGTWHIDIPIRPGAGYLGITGAVYYKVLLRAFVGGQFQGGNGSSLYASDPLEFASITLPDVGSVTPESLGVSITFDSGIASPNVRAVPEPASLIMLGTGALGLLGYSWRRRHRRAA